MKAKFEEFNDGIADVYCVNDEEKLEKMSQSLGELIDKENELLKGAIKSVGQRLKS